jgi:hypothetical protein
MSIETLYSAAKLTGALVNAVVVPAIGKAPLRGLHPKHFPPRIGIPILAQSVSYWQGATGYCVAPFGGVVALDFDASEALEQALNAVPALANTAQVETSKGVHLFVRLPQVINRVLVWRHNGQEMASLRCWESGSYVIGAGSMHPSGKIYKWVHYQSVAHLGEADTERLLGLFNSGRQERQVNGRAVAYARGALGIARAEIAVAYPGVRNSTLFVQARKVYAYVKAGLLSESEVTETLSEIAWAIGLSPGEISATLNSAKRSAQASWALERLRKAGIET